MAIATLGARQLDGAGAEAEQVRPIQAIITRGPDPP